MKELEQAKALQADAAAMLEAATPPAATTDADPAPATPKKKKKKKKKKTTPTGLGTSRGIETMFRTSYRVNMDLSSLADNKANIMISINGIILSIIIASISPKIDANPWLLIPASTLLLGCLVSLIYAVLSARPRVSSKHITLEDLRKNNANILFFGNFANMSEDQFVEGMVDLMKSSDLLYYNMIRDLYGLGSVLVRKYSLLRTSYTIFMIGLILGVLSFIFVFIWLQGQPQVAFLP